MKVLIIPSEHYIVKENPLAGIFQSHHAELLIENNFQVGIISAGFVPFNNLLSSYTYPKFEVKNGIKIYRKYVRTFIPGRIGLMYLNDLLVTMYLKLFKIYIKENGLPDIIHAHNSLFAGTVALKIKEIYKIPFVLTEHSSLFERDLVPKRHVSIAAKVFQNADEITVVSNGLGKTLVKKFGEYITAYTPIYNVLEKSFIMESATALRKHKNTADFIILSIGSLDSNKNHESLLCAFSMRFKGDFSVKLKIGGTGPLADYLADKAETLGIKGQVQFTGSLSRQEVKSEMLNCDVFVLPSKIETFGVVLIEAISVGTPIIATLSGGPEDIVNSTNGLLVPVNDAEALADSLKSIRDNFDKYDPLKIREDCLSRFDRDVFLKRLKTIYSKVR